jgi:sirohydrochlorin cobaltochelatase
VRKVAAELARAGGFEHVLPAFLELGTPDLGTAAGQAVANGARSITVIPYFLTLGLHLERDLPRLIDGIALAHPGIGIRVAAPLDGHPALVQALLDRARKPASD